MSTQTERTERDIARLQHALSGDFRTLHVAYPVLAAHGFMERTPNGFKDIGGDATITRCRQLIAQLHRNNPFPAFRRTLR